MPLTVEDCYLVKDSKIWGRKSGEMPMPVSLTRITVSTMPYGASGSSVTVTVTVPPAGVNFTALLSRFSIT